MAHAQSKVSASPGLCAAAVLLFILGILVLREVENQSLHEYWVLGSIVSQLRGLAVSCGTSCHMTCVARERQISH